MSRKRKAENVAQYLSQDGCDGLRRFVSHATLNLDFSGCDELARERLISAVKGRNTAEITLALKVCSKVVDGLGRAGAQTGIKICYFLNLSRISFNTVHSSKLTNFSSLSSDNWRCGQKYRTCILKFIK